MKPFIPDLPFTTTRQTVLYADSKLWGVIANAAGIKDYQGERDWWSDDITFINKMRKFAYEQGYVENNGYFLTPLGKVWVKLLD